MTKKELVEIMQELRELYPFFEVNTTVLKYWYQAFEMRHVDEIRKAVKRWTTHGRGTPTIESIQQMLAALGVTRNTGSKKFELDPRYQLVEKPEKEIDFVMRVLGVQRVTREICGLVDLPPSGQSVLKLLGRSDWIPAYQSLLGKLYAEAEQVEIGKGNIPF